MPHQDRVTGEWPRWLGFLAALAAVLIVVYRPALQGGLLWDDEAHVTAPALRSVEGLWRIWAEPGSTQQYYPFLHTAFWLEHRLWGDSLTGYHLANLAQHLGAAFLFARILRRLGVPGARFAATLFALHPVQVESVAWISEQKNTLSLLLGLGAVLCHLRFDATRRSRDYWLGYALFLLALLTKSVTATLAPALLVLLWWRRGRLSLRSDALPLLPWFVCGAAAGLFTALVERAYIGAAGAAYDLSWLQRLLLAGRIVWFQCGRLLWPTDPTFIYPRWSVDPASAWQWLPSAGLAALVAASWLARRRTRTPLAVSLLYVGMLFPVLGFLDVYPFRYSYVADHFQYAASLPVLALAAAALAGLVVRLCAGLDGRSAAVRAAARLAPGACLLCTLAALSWQHARDFSDAETLYRATLRNNPECWMAHNNLGLLVSARGERREALLHFRQAVALHPDGFDARNNLGLTLAQTGHPAAALPHLRRAIQLEPAVPHARNNLGIALAACRRPREAAAAFRGALHFMPDSPSIRENLAKALRLDGRHGEAAAEMEKAAGIRESLRRLRGADVGAGSGRSPH